MLSTIFANYANVSYQQLPDSQQVEAGRTVPTRPRAPPAHCTAHLLIRATLTRNCYNVTSILNTMLRGGGSSQTISCPRFLIPKPIFNMSSPMSTFPPKSLAVTCLLAALSSTRLQTSQSRSLLQLSGYTHIFCRRQSIWWMLVI